MNGTMWALVKDKAEKGLTFKQVEIPTVGDNDVKIKIHKTAICGTDVHIYLVDNPSDSHGYELYPDSEQFVKKKNKVKIVS